MQLTGRQRIYIASLLGYVQQAPLSVREPGWEEQGYWGKPVAQATVQPVPSSPTWQILQQVRSPIEYNTVIREFVATPLRLPYPDNLEFRLRVNEGLISDMDFTPGIDRSHAATFPLVRQKTNIVTTLRELIVLECRNTTGAAVQVASGLWGWHYYDPFGEIAGAGEGSMDAATLAEIKALELFDG